MQRTLTFSRDERLLLIAASALPTSRVKARRLKALLYHLETTAGRDGCFPEQTTLAAKMGCTDRTIRNLVNLAGEMGLLTTDRRGRRQLSYCVNWPALRRFVGPADLQKIAEAVAVDDRGRRARALARSMRRDDQNGPDFFSGQNEIFPVTTGNSFRSPPETISGLPISNHSKPPEDARPAENLIDEWAEAEAALFAAGVDQSAKAIAAARSAGVSLEQIREALAYFERLGYVGPAGLFRKIDGMRPGEPVDRRWPKPAATPAGLVLIKTAEGTAAVWETQTAIAIDRRREEETAIDAAKAREAAAAAAIGPELDALDAAELDGLRDRLFARLPILRDRWRRNPADGLVRENLLAEFAREKNAGR